MTLQFKYGVRVSITFFLGLSLFFVAHEPAPFDVLSALLIMSSAAYIVFYSMFPLFFPFLFAQFLAALMELLYFGSVFWSGISIYLFALMVLFIDVALTPVKERYFILGGFFGALITLVCYFSGQNFAIFDEIRMVGFFKDPNVLGATALGLFFLSYPKSKIVAAVFALCLVLSLSRASLIGFFFGLVFVIFHSANNRTKAAIIFLVISMLPFSVELLNLTFSLIGRGQLINSYDFDRIDNWLALTRTWLNSPFPLGPGFSEANGYAVHSTYLRLLIEQGVFSLFAFFLLVFYALFCARKDVWALGALVALLANGLVIDGTHWRVLFIIIGFCIGAGIKRKAVFLQFERRLRGRFPKNVTIERESRVSGSE